MRPRIHTNAIHARRKRYAPGQTTFSLLLCNRKGVHIQVMLRDSSRLKDHRCHCPRLHGRTNRANGKEGKNFRSEPSCSNDPINRYRKSFVPVRLFVARVRKLIRTSDFQISSILVGISHIPQGDRSARISRL